MRAMIVVALFTLGCYSPPRVPGHCEARCASASQQCPGDLVCTAGMCHVDGEPCDLVVIPIDAPSARCVGHALAPFVKLCPETVPDTVELPMILDTTACALTLAQAGGEPLCVIVARTIHIDFSLRVIGENPLLLVATEDLTVSGTIDVASRGGTGTSAGSAANSSRARASAGTSSGTTGAGGAGGGAGSRYGAGGRGGSSFLLTGGGPTPQTSGSVVRGGDAGGAGGGYFGDAGGRGGNGGGAVYLLAGDTLAVTGTINASGERGYGGEPPTAGGDGGGGGGGGGAGGMIVLEGSTISIAPSARIFALGGGGGGGGRAGVAGTDGTDPASPTMRGTGGIPNGGPGANTMNGSPGGDTNNGAGAGGGGGAAGFIRVHPPPPTTVFPSGTAAPAPT